MQFRKYPQNSSALIGQHGLSWLVDRINYLGGRALLFGGAVRSLLNDEGLADIDIKIFLPKKNIANFISWLKSELDNKGYLYREMMVDNERAVFSLSLSELNEDLVDVDLVVFLGEGGLNKALGATFALNAIHLDLKSGYYLAIDQAWSDWENKRLSLVRGYTSLNQHYIYFRAIYLAFKTGHTLERRLLFEMWQRRGRLLEVFDDFLTDENQVRSVFLFKQIFEPRAIDNSLYDQILSKLGILKKLQLVLKKRKKTILAKINLLQLTKDKYFFGELTI